MGSHPSERATLLAAWGNQAARSILNRRTSSVERPLLSGISGSLATGERLPSGAHGIVRERGTSPDSTVVPLADSP